MKFKCRFTFKKNPNLMLKCRDIVKQMFVGFLKQKIHNDDENELQPVIFSRCLFPSPCRHNKMVQNLYFLIFNLTINTLTSTLVVDL